MASSWELILIEQRGDDTKIASVETTLGDDNEHEP